MSCFVIWITPCMCAEEAHVHCQGYCKGDLRTLRETRLDVFKWWAHGWSGPRPVSMGTLKTWWGASSSHKCTTYVQLVSLLLKNCLLLLSAMRSANWKHVPLSSWEDWTKLGYWNVAHGVGGNLTGPGETQWAEAQRSSLGLGEGGRCVSFQPLFQRGWNF